MSTILPDDTVVYNVHEAKTHFSELIARVERGEKIAIARAGKPVVRMDIFWETPTGPKLRFGFLDGDTPDDFFAPPTEEELAEWE